jgi:PIN domain
MPNAKPMPKNAVVDASVLVSAFLFPESVPGRIVSLAEQGVYVLHLSPILLEETRRLLRNPRLRDLYGHTDDAVEAWCAHLHDIGILLTAPLPDIAPACLKALCKGNTLVGWKLDQLGRNLNHLMDTAQDLAERHRLQGADRTGRQHRHDDCKRQAGLRALRGSSGVRW